MYKYTISDDFFALSIVWRNGHQIGHISQGGGMTSHKYQFIKNWYWGDLGENRFPFTTEEQLLKILKSNEEIQKRGDYR